MMNEQNETTAPAEDVVPTPDHYNDNADPIDLSYLKESQSGILYHCG